MKIKALMSVFLVVFVLTACLGQESFHFQGESENWKIVYVTDVVASDNSESGSITMKYIGENESPKEIYYQIEGASGGMSGDALLVEDIFEIPGSSCSGCAVTKEDDEFDVTIDWDGKSENLTLKNKY